jgi:DNA-binding CsgD family transcriptional regulator
MPCLMKAAKLTLLTVAEREALEGLAQGYDIKACATRLGISDHAVNERLRSARRKLGVTSSRAAARMLREDPDQPYSFSGDRFSGLGAPDAMAPSLTSPADQAERMDTECDSGDLREYQLAFSGYQSAPLDHSGLPLRGADARGNSLSKAERVHAMIDLSVKIAAVAALVCLLALAINMATLA